MNTIDPRQNSSDDLPDLLHGIAASASGAASDIDDGDFAALVRARGRALRRQRRNRNYLAATACLAVVAVVGAAVAMNLPGAREPIDPAATGLNVAPTDPGATFPQCGATAPAALPHALTKAPGGGDLVLRSEAHLTDAGEPSSQGRPGETPWATDLEGTIIPLQLANMGDEIVTGTRAERAQVVLVRDGVVVGSGIASAPTPVSFELLDFESTPIQTEKPVPCDADGIELDPGATFPDGDYMAYAVVNTAPADGVLPGDQATDAGSGQSAAWVPFPVYGGPWAIHLGPPSDLPTPALQCGDPTAEITTRSSEPGMDVSVDGPIDPGVDLTGRVTAEVVFRDHSVDYHGTVIQTQAYLLDADGTVVGMSLSDERVEMEFGLGNGDAAATLHPDMPGVDCATGKAIPPGDYELLVITNMLLDGPGRLDRPAEVLGDRTPVTYTAPTGESSGNVTLPELDPTAEFPACGAAVPDRSTEFTLLRTVDVTALTFPDPNTPEAFGSKGKIVNSGDDHVLGNSATAIRAVFVKDGVVVGDDGILTDDARDVDLAPGAHVTLPYSASVGVCGLGDTYRGLPPGDYEVWGSADLYLKERQAPNGTSTSVNEQTQAIGMLDRIELTN